ncbi:MAG: DUF1987 domain-containing protein [Bacteroidales bacterium]|nr:DUF1987 domain-containing protein [Bacteroidales bacterium]
MNSFILEPAEDTPEINFNPETNVFYISKRSLPENAIDYYGPVLEWIQGFLDEKPKQLTIEFKLEYFNTASAKQLAKLLLVLEKYKESTKILVNWFYKPEDKDMLASGTRFSKLIPIDFNFIEY